MATCVATFGAARRVLAGAPWLDAAAARVGDGVGWFERCTAGRAASAVAVTDGESLSRGDVRRGVDGLGALRATAGGAGVRVGVVLDDEEAAAGVTAAAALLGTVVAGDWAWAMAREGATVEATEGAAVG